MNARPRPKAGKLRSLPLHRLDRGGHQPRRAIDGNALKKLAESIRTEGVIQPIFVRKSGNGRFEVVAGERRWHAAKIAGLKRVPTVVGDVTDETALAIALVENLHREDLNPIDQAMAMHRLVEEFGMTHQEVSEIIGKSRAAVTNLLRLLELPSDVRDMVSDGDLDMGHARALLALPRERQQQAAEYAASHHLSVRDVERMAKRSQVANRPPGSTDTLGSASTEAADRAAPSDWLTEDLEHVSLKRARDGCCRVSFSFSKLEELRAALEELDALVERFERYLPQ